MVTKLQICGEEKEREVAGKCTFGGGMEAQTQILLKGCYLTCVEVYFSGPDMC